MTAATPVRAGAPEALFAPGRTGACVGAIALVSLLAFEAMAVATAMPAVAAALNGLPLYALAFGGMLAASMPGMVWAGPWCDRRGPGPCTAAGLASFAAGLLLAGCAGTMPWFVAARCLMGLGSGLLIVALYTGMARVVPSALHPRLFAMFSAAWVVPGLAGPLLAAGLVESLGWRSVFLVALALVPVAAALLLPAFGRLRPPLATQAAAADRKPLAWAALAAAGTLLLHGADKPVVGAMLLAAGLAAVGVSARHLLPGGSLLVRRGLPAVIALRGILAASFATADVFIPLHLTRDAGWTLPGAGLALSAGAVFWSVGSAGQARIVSTRGRRLGLRIGILLVAAGIAGVALTVREGLPAWSTVAAWGLSGLGVGLGLPTLSVRMLELSEVASQGRHSAALQLSDALCTTAALSVAGVLFLWGGRHGSLGGVLVLGLAAALALVGAALAGRAFPGRV